MGVLNVTPNSFSDGGDFFDLQKAENEFYKLVDAGADIIDIGGESTGPGSEDVSSEEETQRIIPLLQKIKNKSKVLVSVDTYKPDVAKAAIEAGADIINDILAGRSGENIYDDEEYNSPMFRLIAEKGVKYIMMYSKDNSGRTSLTDKDYQDVVKEIGCFLAERVKKAQFFGVKDEQIIIDPGMGAFISSKSEYSLEVLKRLSELKFLDKKILIACSRKGFIGEITGVKEPKQRIFGSIAAAIWAFEQGVDIIRTHDVAETRQSLLMWQVLKNS